MSEQHPLPEDERKTTRVRFLNREAAEVYLLLDFLSGRADRSLRPTTDEQARALLQDRLLKSDRAIPPELLADAQPAQEALEIRRAKIEADLQDPTQLVLRTMQIKYPIQEDDKEFEAQAAFLMRARDVLSSRAAPANGATIAFTSMLSGQRSKTRHYEFGGVTSWEFAEIAYPWLMPEADHLARSIRNLLILMFAVLVLAVAISSYAAWGKSLLDTLDAVRRDDGAVQQTLRGSLLSFPGAPDGLKNNRAPMSLNCDVAHPDNGDLTSICVQLIDIRVRNEVTHSDLARWEYPLRRVDPEQSMGRDAEAGRKATEHWATAAVTVLGNYIMPILYASLGSLAFILRRYYDRLAASLVSPRDRRANYIRLLLGTLIGGCIGLVYSGTGAAQATGTLGLAVTLSTSALAFIAGYGVEGVFQALDTLITQVFRVNGTGKPQQPPTS